jgi:hypothetical protein
LYFQIEADDLHAARLLLMARAVAKFGETHVPALAQFHSGGDEDAIDFQANLPLEFKENVYLACVVGVAAQYPAAAGQNCPGKGLCQSRRFFHGNSLHLHCPGHIGRRFGGEFDWRGIFHNVFIGAAVECMISVQERNGL